MNTYTYTQPNRRGFTIVELLIVIVVIGILAAITLVAFGGIRDRANDSTVLSDLSATGKSIAAFHAVNGVYPSGSATFNQASANIIVKPTRSAMDLNSNNYLACFSSGQDYILFQKSSSGKTFYVGSRTSNTPREYTATTFPRSAGDLCIADGVTHITNSWGYTPPSGSTGGWLSWVQ